MNNFKMSNSFGNLTKLPADRKNAIKNILSTIRDMDENIMCKVLIWQYFGAELQVEF